MQDETNSPGAPGVDETEHLVLLLLTERAGQGIWSRAEIARLIGDPLAGADAVAGLHAAGLVHCFDEFVFPTQPAVRYRQLEETR